jgi:amino acid permease
MDLETSNLASLVLKHERQTSIGTTSMGSNESFSSTGIEVVLQDANARKLLPFDIKNHSQKTTLNETSMNTALALVGSGVLGIPYAFGQSGFLCGAVLAVVALLCMWTALLIGELMECTEPMARAEVIEESAHDWPFIGWAAFGDVGRAVVTCCQLGELWGVMLGFLVVNGVNMNLIFPRLSNEVCIIICGCFSFLLLFPSAKTLSYFSGVGICATLLAVGSLVWSAESMAVWESQVEGIKWLDYTQIPMAVGIIQFCFVAHGALPTMYREMKSPRAEYAPAMKRAFVFAGIFYMAVGGFAFYVYESQAQPNFMANLGRDLSLQLIPGKAFLYMVATAFFYINIQFSFPLFALGLVTASELGLNIARRGFAIRTLWKITFLAFTTGIAVLLKDCMAPVLSLVGCFCATNTCLLFPMIFTLKLRKTSRMNKVVIGFALIYGFYTLIFGSYHNVTVIMDMLSGV